MRLAYRNDVNAKLVAEYWGKPLDRPDWFRMEEKSAEEAEVFIYDVIGWPFVPADEFVRALSALTAKRILVRINSPGGDVFDGAAIYNALKAEAAKRQVTTRIESLAASAASIIALAGSEVQAFKTSWMMIHEPYMITIGNQYELREDADFLGKISITMIDVYHGASDIGKREIKQMLKDTTWFTAAEAKDRGMVDVIVDAGEAAKARFELGKFANVPKELLADGQAPTRTDADGSNGEPTKRTIEAALREAGLTREKAQALIAGGMRALGVEKEERKRQEVLESAQATLKIYQGRCA